MSGFYKLKGPLLFEPQGVGEFAGSGSPEGVVTARPGSTYRDKDGATGLVLYYKDGGTGFDKTGWVPVNAGASGGAGAFSDLAATGILTMGSGPTAVTDAAGKVLSAALNTVAVAQGGTGAATLTSGGLLVGAGTSAVSATLTPSGLTSLAAGTLSATTTLVVATRTPASAVATGTAGTIAWDASFIYVCVATDTWKRVAIATW